MTNYCNWKPRNKINLDSYLRTTWAVYKSSSMYVQPDKALGPNFK